jgi:hypothetical protein
MGSNRGEGVEKCRRWPLSRYVEATAPNGEVKRNPVFRSRFVGTSHGPGRGVRRQRWTRATGRCQRARRHWGPPPSRLPSGRTLPPRCGAAAPSPRAFDRSCRHRQQEPSQIQVFNSHTSAGAGRADNRQARRAQWQFVAGNARRCSRCCPAGTTATCELNRLRVRRPTPATLTFFPWRQRPRSPRQGPVHEVRRTAMTGHLVRGKAHSAARCATVAQR